ncbi:MAG: hypothetical protein ACD_45C00233G0003 [uncultured bacterium]|nr:MAG: hypothetical protein ACD_45C00233G0003 [uncultured bacterium]
MKNIFFIFTISMALSFLTGCASIVNGTNQSVSVNTTPTKGATCSLENDKGKWYVGNTPGSVTVHRSYQDLIVDCEKKGYPKTVKSVASKTKGMAFGNVVFGGIIGAGVDVVDGSAYDYPTDIQIPMSQRG